MLSYIWKAYPFLLHLSTLSAYQLLGKEAERRKSLLMIKSETYYSFHAPTLKVIYLTQYWSMLFTCISIYMD